MPRLKYSEELSKYTTKPRSLKEATLDIFDALVPQKGLIETLKIIYNEKKEGGGFRRAVRILISDRFDALSEFKNITDFDVTEDNLQNYFAGILTKCKICGKPILSRNIYCSRECYFSDTEPYEKRANTNLERYGVTETFASPQVREKSYETQRKKYGTTFIESEYGQNKLKQAIIDKYGVDNYAKTNECKEKIKQTNIERYGTPYPAQSSICKEKTIQTNLEKFGAPHYSMTKGFKERYQNTCIEKFGAPYPMQSAIGKEKHIQTNLERYGVPWSSQSEQYLRNHYIKLLEDNFPEVKLKEDDSVLTVLKDLITQKYVKDDIFDSIQLAQDFKLNSFEVSKLKRRLGIEFTNISVPTSQAEKDLFNFIQDSSKIANDRELISPLELDIVIPNKNLAIEYDGLYWHSDAFRDSYYHISKTMACKEKQYQLLHIFENDNIDIWKSVINNKLGLSNKIYARKCVVSEVDTQSCAKFLNENHLQGNSFARIKLGLFYQDELVQVMTFGKPRFNKHYEYELIRMCSKLNTTVVGGASKLFKHFIKNYNPTSIISYANLRWSDGNVYEKLGFKFVNRSNPNYFYFDNHGIYSRNQFQKHKLKHFESYSDTKSEAQIMAEEGFMKIYDCGNLVYEYKPD